MRARVALALLGLFGCSRAPGTPTEEDEPSLRRGEQSVTVELIVQARPPVVDEAGVIWPREQRAIAERAGSGLRAWHIPGDGALVALESDAEGAIVLDAGAQGRLVVAAARADVPVSVRDCNGVGCIDAPVWGVCIELAGGPGRVAIDESTAVGGAFWLVQTLERGYRAATDAFVDEQGSAKQIALIAAWRRGQTPTCETSCFDADGATGVISVLSTDDDTDEYDDHVILHEIGHFIEWAWLGGTSGGGFHDGAPVSPRLAFSEGFATWFATAVDASSVYIDSNRHGGAWADYTQMPVLPPRSLDSATSEEWVTVLLREVIGYDGLASIARLADLRRALDGEAFGALSVLVGHHGAHVDRVLNGALSRFLDAEGLGAALGDSAGQARDPRQKAAQSPITPLRIAVANESGSATIVARESVERVQITRHRSDGTELADGAVAFAAPENSARLSALRDEAFVRARFDLVGGVRYFASAAWHAAAVPSGGAVEDVQIDGFGVVRCASLSAGR